MDPGTQGAEEVMDRPIRYAEVRTDIEEFTERMLSAYGGSGRIIVELDFKNGVFCGYNLGTRQLRRGARRPQHATSPTEGS